MTLPTNVTRPAVAVQPGLRQGLERWAGPLLVLAALIGISLVVFKEAAEAAVRVWLISPTFTHCFLIVPISLWLLWRRRHLYAAMTPQPTPLPILLGSPIAVALWLAGTLATVNELQQLALVALWQVLIAATLGWRVYRVALFACLYLFLMVPLGAYLVPPMQQATAWFVDAGLGVLEIPHHRTGMVIDVPSERFEVAAACAGLRFLIATITLSLLFCKLTFRRPLKIVLFLAASIIVPVVANWLRALSIVVLAYVSDNQLAVGFDHLVYGWGFSVLNLLVLLVVGSWFRDVGAGRPPVLRREVPWTAGTRHTLLAVSAASGLLAIAAGPMVLGHLARAGGGLDTARVFVYPAPPGWRRVPASVVWDPQADGAADQTRFGLMPGGGTPISVDVTLFRFDGAAAGHNAAEAALSLWDQAAWRKLDDDDRTLALRGHVVTLREETIETVSEQRLVWWVCVLGDNAATGGLRLKYLSLKAATLGPPGATLVVLSSRVANGNFAAARARLAEAGAGVDELLHRNPTAADSESPAP